MKPLSKELRVLVAFAALGLMMCNMPFSGGDGATETSVAQTIQARDSQATIQALQVQLTALSQAPTVPPAAPTQTPVAPTEPPPVPEQPLPTATKSGPARILTLAETICLSGPSPKDPPSSAGSLPAGVEIPIQQKLADNSMFFVVYYKAGVIDNMCWVPGNAPTIQILGDLSAVPIFTPK